MYRICPGVGIRLWPWTHTYIDNFIPLFWQHSQISPLYRHTSHTQAHMHTHKDTCTHTSTHVRTPTHTHTTYTQTHYTHHIHTNTPHTHTHTHAHLHTHHIHMHIHILTCSFLQQGPYVQTSCWQDTPCPWQSADTSSGGVSELLPPEHQWVQRRRLVYVVITPWHLYYRCYISFMIASTEYNLVMYQYLHHLNLSPLHHVNWKVLVCSLTLTTLLPYNF